MNSEMPFNRRQFIKIGTLAASASLLPSGAQAAPASAYSLPALPYAFDSLAPHIDAKTMEIHHGKHHAAYINSLNTGLDSAPAELKKQPLPQLLSGLPSIADETLRNTIRNHGGGHWNHDFFWKILCPAAQSGTASEPLARAIDSAFGSMDQFKKSFAEASAKRFGSGWAWLIVQNGELKITSTPNQDNPLMRGPVADAELGTPILGLDVWEHAYYLNYQNRRPDYVSAWWNVVNWSAVSKNFETAS
jgi:Fe-Mn family superoxide dismutase